MRFLTSKDFLAGLMFVLFGALGLYLSMDYRVGTGSRMGPGYMPRLLCWSVIALGAIVMIRGILAHEGIERGRWRPLVLITLAIVAFSLLIDSAGLLISGSALIVIGAFGGPEFKLREVVPMTAVLLAGSFAIFIWALGLPITFLPR